MRDSFGSRVFRTRAAGLLLAAALSVGGIFFSAVPASAGSTGIDLCAQAAHQAGFQGAHLVEAIAIGMAESNCVPSSGSAYRGIWQIGRSSHPEVSDQCAYDAYCSAQATFGISNQGTNWCQWQTWSGAGCSNGSYDNRYQTYLNEAQAAASRVQGVAGVPVTSGVPTLSL
ncbi:hypothetical protein F0L68_41040, partial [Solihabitans fulvus]